MFSKNHLSEMYVLWGMGIVGVELRIRHRNCRLYLKIEHKITVIVGLSGTGKSIMHRALTDGNAATRVVVSDSRYQVEYLQSREYAENVIGSGVFKGYRIYLIDEGKLNVDNDIARAIQYSANAYFIITSRTDLNMLNFDMFAVKELETQSNGVTVLKDYMRTCKEDRVNSVYKSINSSVIEDRGKALQWFSKLFKTIEITRDSAVGGKEKVCAKLVEKLESTEGQVLVIFDACSFGSCIKEFKGIMEVFSNRIMVLSDYRSWEYLMLCSNMFNNKFVEYGISIPMFEERYYENLLEELSKECGHGIISHSSRRGSNSISKCYTEPCCAYEQTSEFVCKTGLAGSDKFVAMLMGTKFEYLLVLAGRKI